MTPRSAAATMPWLLCLGVAVTLAEGEPSAPHRRKVAELKDGSVRTFEVSPADAGLGEHPIDALQGGAPEENAATMFALLAGESGPIRDFVLINAAASLVVADAAKDLKAGVALTADAIDSGRARAALDRLVAITNEPPPEPDEEEPDEDGSRSAA